MQTTKRTAERLGYLAGAVFPIAIWVAITLEEQGRTFPNFEEGAIGAQALRDYFEVSAVNAAGEAVGIFAMLLLVWFAGALYFRSTRISERARPAATFGIIGAVVFAAFVASESGPSFVAQNDPALVDPAVLLSWYAGSELLGGLFIAGFLALAGLLGSVAYLGFAHEVIPRWAAWPAAVLATTLATGTVLAPLGEIGFIAWLSFMAFTLWIFVLAVRLTARPSDVPVVKRSRKGDNVPHATATA